MEDRGKLKETLSTFIIANHILAQHGIVDGFGHISVRNPDDPSRFFTTTGVSPALVSPSTIGEYTVEGAHPIPSNPGAPTLRLSPYSERFIHASLLARFPSVNAVIHSHSPIAVSFSVGNVPLRPVWHMAGFLEADGVRVWDIDEAYRAGQESGDDRVGEKHNLLVNNQRLGDSLAEAFAAPAGAREGAGEKGQGQGQGMETPRRQVVLQRGHGFAVVGRNLQEVVYRAVYTQENAKVLRDALSMGGADAVRYLTHEEVRDCLEMADGSWSKAWPLWAKEASVGALFQNQLSEG
ncbi:arad-like aldolase/epimerase [Viridothelium virens]|uniref:Arad-like aldolase/epimerase n=1 Tax=Viridothelium virens TaxID=1048519 RepID=A0A6A6HA64_VIRVR|nr:arad-like aldolase/epimerase [Viridothelium virens]